MFIPLRVSGGEPPLRCLEQDLHPAVVFGILAGSIAAGMAGFLMLRYAPAQR